MAFWLRDKERSPFGLGWEHNRRGLSIDSNPFEEGTNAWRDFRAGWRRYIPSKSACYNDEEVTSPKRKAK